MKKSFGSRELYNCLINLGFTPLKQKGTSHLKFLPPKSKRVLQAMRPFIMMQMGEKTFDPHSASRYIRQIIQFGFSEEEIVKALKK